MAKNNDDKEIQQGLEALKRLKSQIETTPLNSPQMERLIANKDFLIRHLFSQGISMTTLQDYL